MPLLRTGRDQLAGLATGASCARYDSTGAIIFVASATSAHDSATTWIWPSGNACASTMESGYPIRAGNIVQHRGLYSTAQANFQWESWGIHNATASNGSSGYLLNHAPAQALGTKTSAQSWQITTSITFTT